jgi:phage shock protein C
VGYSPDSGGGSASIPWPARILFSLLLLIVPGSQILLYPLFWILMPAEERVAAPVADSRVPMPTA